MTEQAGKKKTPPAPLAAEEIAAYLKQSPHFFDAHPDAWPGRTSRPWAA